MPDILDFGEMYDIAGLIAPRHLLVVNGAKDPLFDAADVEHAAAKVATVYSAAKTPSHFELRWGPAGHRFYADLMWPFIAQAINETGTK